MSDKLDTGPYWGNDAIDPSFAATQRLAREYDELRAENERLTLDNQRLTEMWDTDRESLTAENTRLRLALSRSDSDEMQLLRAEHERLRAAIEALRGQMPHWVANTLKAVEQDALGSDG